MWRPFRGSSRGSAPGPLDFSEPLGLLDFLSAFPVPDDLERCKRVYSTAGWGFDAKGTLIRKSVVEWASALPLLLADPFIRWEGHLTLQRVTPRSGSSGRFGKAGAVGGEVAVLILSTSMPRQGGKDLAH
jgi:hypothetical protein